jgi:hypothetical protein
VKNSFINDYNFTNNTLINTDKSKIILDKDNKYINSRSILHNQSSSYMYEPGELIRKEDETDVSISTDEEGDIDKDIYTNDSLINYDRSLKKKKKKLVEVDFFGRGDSPPLLPLERDVKTKPSPNKKTPNKKIIPTNVNKYNNIISIYDNSIDEVDEDLELFKGFVSPRLELNENSTRINKYEKQYKKENEIQNQENNDNIEFNNDITSTKNLDKLNSNGGHPIESVVKNNNSHILLKPNQRIRVFPSNKKLNNTLNYINEDNIRKEVNKFKFLDS